MALLSFLKQDHQKIRTRVVGLLETANPPEQVKIEELVNLLRIHMEMEENILYPQIAKIASLSHQSKTLIQEHKNIKALIQKITEKPAKDVYGLNEILQNLLDELDHHVEEEENEVIPALVKEVKTMEIDKLVDLMAEFKEQRVKTRF